MGMDDQARVETPIQVAAEVDGQVLGASCKIVRIEGRTIRVSCTEDKDPKHHKAIPKEIGVHQGALEVFEEMSAVYAARGKPSAG